MGGKKSKGGGIALFWELPLSFFCGVLLGQVLALAAPDAVADDLRRCLMYDRTTHAHGPTLSDWASAAAVYLRYPALAVLLNGIGAGAIPLCGVSAVFGCVLSYGAGSFVRAVGRRGTAVAASAIGIRCLVTIPCFLSLAAPVSWAGCPRAGQGEETKRGAGKQQGAEKWQGAGKQQGAGKRQGTGKQQGVGTQQGGPSRHQVETVRQGRGPERRWDRIRKAGSVSRIRLFCWGLILLAGMAGDLLLTPKLLEWACEWAMG